MPNPHYQHVLEQDEQLPTPMRWLTRAMSSWWTIVPLTVFVAGYVAIAHVPVGGRYLWQSRLIDSTQQEVLTWWPLMAGAWLLAGVILWAGFRRLPWRIGSLGRMVCVLGLAVILVSQSWAFRAQTTGVIAVPISVSDDGGEPDPLSLTYTTRFGDTTDRVLVFMVGGVAPVAVPLDGLPRWNDAAGDEMPVIRLHADPRLAANVGFIARIRPIAYVADGALTQQTDGTQRVTPTPTKERRTTDLPYPADALICLRIEADTPEGDIATTDIWLPFEPEGTDALAPDRFYNVEGLGTVGLAFRPGIRKLPFAIAASDRLFNVKGILAPTLQIADADAEGRLVQPASHTLSMSKRETAFLATTDEATMQQFNLHWQDEVVKDRPTHLLIVAATGLNNPFISAGLVTFVLGVGIDLLLGWFGPAPKQKRNPQQAKK